MAYSENPSRVMVFPDGNSGNGNVPAWVLPFMGGNFGNNGGLFRRSPRMRGGRGGGQGSYNMPRMRGGIGGYAEVPPHMRGYVVRPEDEDWMYNERYNW